MPNITSSIYLQINILQYLKFMGKEPFRFESKTGDPCRLSQVFCLFLPPLFVLDLNKILKWTQLGISYLFDNCRVFRFVSINSKRLFALWLKICFVLSHLKFPKMKVSVFARIYLQVVRNWNYIQNCTLKFYTCANFKFAILQTTTKTL